MKARLSFCGMIAILIFVALCLSAESEDQPVDYHELIRLSDVIVKGEVIKMEEAKVFSFQYTSTGICYVRPDYWLKGDPVTTEVTLVDYMPVVVRSRTVPAVRVGWWRDKAASECPCTISQTNIWFLHLSPGSMNTYSIVSKPGISAERKILEAVQNKK